MLQSAGFSRLAELSRTLFQEHWWLAASSGGTVEVVHVNWEGQQVASLAFMRRNRFGHRSLVMPPYTRTLGPVLSLPVSTPSRHAKNLRRVVRELIVQLPSHETFHQTLDPEVESGLAFLIAGCEIGQSFTFRITPDTPLKSVFERIDGRTRRLIRACSEQLSVESTLDLDRFIRLSYRDRPPIGNYHDFAAITRIFDACVRREQAIILTATGENGCDQACVVLVWGGRVLYYLLPARDRDLASGGTNAFLLWEAIKFAHSRDLVFDFDGFGSSSTAKFLLSFGVFPLARTSISHRNLLGQLVKCARDLVGRRSAPF
jgi:Acetyltransferase (GNAT) domain